MKAVVMAGGEGSRLRPLTINRPKPMVPICNRPVMGHIIELLKQHHIDDVVATLQYRAGDIQNYFGDGSNVGVEMHYSVEPRPLGTAGSVKFAANFLNDDPFLVISGDALTDFNLTEIVEFHKRVGAAVTITLYRVPTPLEYGVIIIDAQGRVERFLEKPSWGEVISDTVNTGIYVISPEVLDLVEPGTPVDFSKDLFPELMKRGAPLYGFVANGYWTDVGNISEYMRATSDLLSGKVNLGEVGRHIGGGIYVEDDVEIAPDAQLYGPIYLGLGSRVKGGVVMHGPTAIRPYNIVDNLAHIDRSIVWRNSYIGEGAELRGAIVGRRCTLKSRVVVFEGAVLGDECMVDAGAVIHPNVKIWPNKEIEAGATVKSSLVWGSQARRALFGRFGVTGLVNVDLTPEFAARLSAAFGATLPKGSSVIINRDPHRAARMIKRAMVSGLPSAGVTVQDVNSVPIPVARYFTGVSGASGGVHVRLSPFDQRVVDIRFFDKDGMNLGKAKERSVENVFFREDFRRVSFDELGRIEEVGGVPERYYIQGFLKALNVQAIREAHFNLAVDYASAPTSLILPLILNELGCTVVALNERIDENKMSMTGAELLHGMDQLTSITGAVKADLGLRFDVGGERVWIVDNLAEKLTGAQVAAAFMELALRASGDGSQPRVVAVMVNQPRLFDEIAARHGAQIRRTPIDPQALMNATGDPNVLLAMSGAGEFIMPSFHRLIDAMFAAAKLLEFLATQRTKLSDVVATLPPYHVAQKRVACPWDQKGTVMRLLNEQYKDKIIEQVDGVKLQVDDGSWILVVPEPDEAVFTLFAEAPTDQAASALADRYVRVIEGMRS
ncbi:MAG: mannose-1-phosphate guanyltransferase [Chloroflexi bacterium]|nr:mannose-1-phosphate guanyltransferase [Chloroflexota bacterium]MCL5952688.1 mannose-1-phosphate guanyltransferase [Chloroflexota bacterium]